MLRAFRIVSCLIIFSCSVANAEEETDRGSRTVHKSTKETKAPFTVDYHAGVFGAFFIENTELGLLADVGVRARMAMSKTQFLGAKLRYLHDPFSTKSFNFADESLSADPAIAIQRIAQPIDDFEAQLKWNSKWSSRWRSNIVADFDARFPSFDTDQRFSVGLLSQLRYGKKRGGFLKLNGKLAYVSYPKYIVSNRELNQNRERLKLEGGWVFKNRSLVSAGLEGNFTQYLNAKYDAQDSTGATIDAVESKSYRSYEPFVSGAWRITKKVKIKGKYNLQFHNTSNYDRDTQGRDQAGSIERRYIPNYYDYTRHRARFDVDVKLFKKLQIGLLAEFWTREFSTYEARNVDNQWIEEKRSDQSIEIGLESAYRMLSFGKKSLASSIYLTGSASFLKRISNMKREVSFSTNYDVTRILLGFEIRSK